ncbi:MAG: lipid A deacylase LpxR family protein [Parvularcula sp.]|jgi:hypothetical protein|nr:lipid A deacylase LpxR family protein [Parvularcula sp.]
MTCWHHPEKKTSASLFLRLVLALASVAAVTPASAEDPIPAKTVYSFVVENDAPTQQDQYYTSGARLEVSREVHGGFNWERTLLHHVLRASSKAQVVRDVALNHAIFTPNEIEIANPQPGDRPWAGYLSGEYRLGSKEDQAIRSVALEIGVVGPASQADEIQTWLHTRVFDTDVPVGWDNQIENEVGFILSYDNQFPAATLYGDIDRGVDVFLKTGGSAGTIRTDARLAGFIRAGTGLDQDLGVPRLNPALSNSGFFQAKHGFDLYGFLGVEGRYVAHSVFLEGSLFRENDPSVNVKRYVYDAQIGLVAHWGRMQTSVTFVRRSEEFETQSSAQEFMTLSISFAR